MCSKCPPLSTLSTNIPVERWSSINRNTFLPGPGLFNCFTLPYAPYDIYCTGRDLFFSIKNRNFEDITEQCMHLIKIPMNLLSSVGFVVQFLQQLFKVFHIFTIPTSICVYVFGCMLVSLPLCVVEIISESIFLHRICKFRKEHEAIFTVIKLDKIVKNLYGFQNSNMPSKELKVLEKGLVAFINKQQKDSELPCSSIDQLLNTIRSALNSQFCSEEEGRKIIRQCQNILNELSKNVLMKVYQYGFSLTDDAPTEIKEYIENNNSLENVHHYRMKLIENVRSQVLTKQIIHILGIVSLVFALVTIILFLFVPCPFSVLIVLFVLSLVFAGARFGCYQWFIRRKFSYQDGEVLQHRIMIATST